MRTLRNVVEYSTGIRFFPEPVTKELAEGETWDVDALVRQALEAMPEDAWAFRLGVRVVETWTMDDSGEKGERVKHEWRPGRYYPSARAYTVAEIEAMPGDHRILAGNVQGNDRTGNPRGVRCRLGNWQMLEPGDVVLDEQGRASL